MAKQKRQKRYLEWQTADLRRLEKYKQQRRLSENPAGASASGKAT